MDVTEESVIRGVRNGTRKTVTIDGHPLDWTRSLRVASPSPSGIEWGYPGSGPAQLALAILLELVDDETAEWHHQAFKWGFIARLDHDEWTIAVKDVVEWLRNRRGVIASKVLAASHQ